MNCVMVRLEIRAAHLRAALFASVLLAHFLCIPPRGQSQTQQYVYANVPAAQSTSTIPSFVKNGQTGALTAVAGSPFPDRLEGGQIAVDALGRFLFVINPTSNDISMYQIDSSTGALSEVPNSPFAAGLTTSPFPVAQPISLATEKSGKVLYAGYATGTLRNNNIPTTSAIVPFNIDSANLTLSLTSQLSLDIPSQPVQMFSDPRGLFLYIAQGLFPFTSTVLGQTSVWAISPTDGTLSRNGTAGDGSEIRCIASDPQGRFFYQGQGQFEGSIGWGTISPLDGTVANLQVMTLDVNDFPHAMVVDNSGKFLYVQENSGLVIYSIDQTTGQPTALGAPLATPSFRFGTVVADPAGPFLYANSGSALSVFQIDAQNGALTDIQDLPFASGNAASGVAISGVSGQSISGPNAAFTPTSLNFTSVVEGQSVTLPVHLVNNGDQTLTINVGATTITGPNKADFSQTTTCLPTLAVNANCSFSVTFTPSIAGAESAALQITDNAPGSPQTIPLSGTGLATTPSIAFSPGSIVFPAVAQGSPEGPLSFVVTNIGSAPLHISAVALGGSNPQDFSQTNNCTSAAIAINASCNIDVSFTPQATGDRGATISMTDDAQNSPQLLSVSGTGATPFVLGPSPQSTTTASVTAGQTAQYNLQLNPGTGFTGTIALSCSGAPTAAKCTLSPASLAVTSSNPVAFSAMISTTGSSTGVVPTCPVSQIDWRRFYLLAGVSLFLIVLLAARCGSNRRSRRAVALAGITLALAIAGVSGCGGGGGSIAAPSLPPAPPAPQVTPKGSYPLTVTATAGNLPPQTVTLTLNVN